MSLRVHFWFILLSIFLSATFTPFPIKYFLRFSLAQFLLILLLRYFRICTVLSYLGRQTKYYSLEIYFINISSCEKLRNLFTSITSVFQISTDWCDEVSLMCRRCCFRFSVSFDPNLRAVAQEGQQALVARVKYLDFLFVSRRREERNHEIV